MRTIFKSLLFLLMCSCATSSSKNEKINGVSFVASKEKVHSKHINPVLNIHANYAAIMPFGFIKELSHPDIQFNSDRQWFGETKVGVKQYVERLKAHDIKIMIKPQLWVWHGEFTGGIKMTLEDNWKLLEASYSKFILEYAEVAEAVDADIFCIGTELEGFIDNRPNYWKQLIIQIREIYKGKLTYAANWNEYNRTPFWSQLDYIGIDAYFPVSNEKTPTIEVLRNGWKTHKQTIKTFHETYKKPILFTEYGYRSVDFTGKQPWNSDTAMTVVNLEGQTNATQVLFETFWNENWFAGGFIWKWFHNHEASGGEEDSQFTPQNKPVEAILKKHYAQY